MIAILTSKNQWFTNYAKILSSKIENSHIFFDHIKIDDTYNIVFILSYHKIIEDEYLLKHKHNIIIHASKLPKGKGWAPLFWQVLEGKNNIYFTMFEASNKVDDGDIYMIERLKLNGYELNQDLRYKQANLIIDMCIKFLNDYEKYKIPFKQIGKSTFYKRRTPLDSELDINDTISNQFNLLRIVDNSDYPAFFYKDGIKYKLKIERDS
jgi:methionyl-tRNA formyltransferase